MVTILVDRDGYEICFVEDEAFYDLATPTYDVVDFAARAKRGGDGNPPPSQQQQQKEGASSSSGLLPSVADKDELEQVSGSCKQADSLGGERRRKRRRYILAVPRPCHTSHKETLSWACHVLLMPRDAPGAVVGGREAGGGRLRRELVQELQGHHTSTRGTRLRVPGQGWRSGDSCRGREWLGACPVADHRGRTSPPHSTYHDECYTASSALNAPSSWCSSESSN